ncbi:MAG: hypothetical protein ACI87N_002727 [Flavobacteriales bacterium]|jgi:hypothetical protein
MSPKYNRAHLLEKSKDLEFILNFNPKNILLHHPWHASTHWVSATVIFFDIN